MCSIGGFSRTTLPKDIKKSRKIVDLWKWHKTNPNYNPDIHPFNPFESPFSDIRSEAPCLHFPPRVSEKYHYEMPTVRWKLIYKSAVHLTILILQQMLRIMLSKWSFLISLRVKIFDENKLAQKYLLFNRKQNDRNWHPIFLIANVSCLSK